MTTDPAEYKINNHSLPEKKLAAMTCTLFDHSTGSADARGPERSDFTILYKLSYFPHRAGS
jgi:hypothetical protein